MLRFTVTVLALLAAIATVLAQRLYLVTLFTIHLLTPAPPPLLNPAAPAPSQPPAEESVAVACARISRRLAEPRPTVPQDLTQLTRRQLQQLAGTRRNLPKQQLIALAQGRMSPPLSLS